MRPVRVVTAGVTSASALMLALLAGCGTQPASPGAAPPASSSPSATVTPVPTATPTPTTRPSIPAPTQVVSSRVTYPWHWPNDVMNKPARVTHSYAVPPVPELVSISVGNHPAAAGQRPFTRMSFTFTTAFPSYRFGWARIVSDGSGKAVPIKGTDTLKIVFTQAQAHTADGTRSTIVSQPGRPIGYQSMTDYAQAGDFEGVLTYGIGVTRAVLMSNPQTQVRAYEVETVLASGQHRYVVAIDIDANGLG